jgi:hypothetical protein
MKRIRVVLAFGFTLALVVPAGAQTTLYVNGSTGNDSVSKANNSASSPWRTIGRAAWGSTNRSGPNASEAAAAGDRVMITGGTYTTSVAVNNRWGVVYNPVNQGTASNPITFTCVGDCVLGAPNANAPVIGAEGRNYIRWYADIGQGHSWQITAYGPQGGSAGPTQVNTAPDTGPVVCHGSTGCWIEGADIDGGVQTDYDDNWNGVRLENCTACTVRSNTIRNFRLLTFSSANASAVTTYGSPNAIIENNYATNVPVGIYFKDSGHTLLQQGIHARNNKFDGVNQCFRFSMTAEGRNYVYQNLCVDSTFGMLATGGGLSNDWIFNNTFYNLSGAAVYPTSLGSGGRFWNNIVYNTPRVVLLEGASMPAATVIHFEHNVYFGHGTFYSGPEGNRTLSSFRSLFASQESAAPLSIEANPLFVNAAGGDFRLCVGPGNPAASCTGTSPALAVAIDIFDLDADGNTTETIRAGAHITNNEVMGVPNGIQRPQPPTNVRIITP